MYFFSSDDDSPTSDLSGVRGTLEDSSWWQPILFIILCLGCLGWCLAIILHDKAPDVESFVPGDNITLSASLWHRDSTTYAGSKNDRLVFHRNATSKTIPAMIGSTITFGDTTLRVTAYDAETDRLTLKRVPK